MQEFDTSLQVSVSPLSLIHAMPAGTTPGTTHHAHMPICLWVPNFLLELSRVLSCYVLLCAMSCYASANIDFDVYVYIINV